MVECLGQVDKSHSKGSLTSYIKGAPERVLSKCSTFLAKDGSVEPVTDEFRESYDNAYDVSAAIDFVSERTFTVPFPVYSIWLLGDIA